MGFLENEDHFNDAHWGQTAADEAMDSRPLIRYLIDDDDDNNNMREGQSEKREDWPPVMLELTVGTAYGYCLFEKKETKLVAVREFVSPHLSRVL